MCKVFAIYAATIVFALLPCLAQNTAGTAKPAEHILGTVTKVDPAAHSVTVKDDKTGSETLVLVGNTRTLLKVPPGAKDLKAAQRITADDLEVGDRVDVRGSKAEDQQGAITARSVVLMSARDLAQAHQAEAAAWQHSTAGIVTSIDAATGKLSITLRTPEGPKPVIVNTSASTQFTRYSIDTPKTPAPSRLTDIQPGDQVRIIGEQSADATTITAQKVYSGAFRTVAGTVTAISPDAKQLTIKNLQTKQPVQVTLNADSVMRKLPPMMAAMLARRLNPDYRAAQAGAGGGENGGGARAVPSGEASNGRYSGGNNYSANRETGNSGGGSMRTGTGDLSRIIERAPVISVSELKTGDALVISGTATGAGNTSLVASSVIAGVEPIFQSAPERQARSLGDWSLDMEAPAQ